MNFLTPIYSFANPEFELARILQVGTTMTQAPKYMGISINLYRVAKAEKIDDIKDLQNETEKAKDKKVDLYKITTDLAIIFSNKAFPFDDLTITTTSHKMLFGNMVSKTVGYREIGGFIPSSEVAIICKYIREHNLQTFEGFAKLYDNVSKEAKTELIEMGNLDKKELFSYLKPLTDFYFAAEKDNNSIVIVGE